MSGRSKKTIYRPIGFCLTCAGKKYAEGEVEDGFREGLWTFYYPSGAKQMEGVYRHGRKQGNWIKYWENGQPLCQGELDDGLMHGVWTEWYENGQPARKSRFDHGRKAGTWTIHDPETGKEVRQEQHDPEEERTVPATLMSDRDAAETVKRVRRALLFRSWNNLVGPRVARVLEPWQVALWILLFVPAYAWASKSLGGLNTVLAALAIATGVSVFVVAALALHDHFTRPDAGTDEISRTIKSQS